MGKQSLLLPPEPKYHILIVEDGEELGVGLVEYFAERYFKAFHVMNADDGFKYLNKHQVDVVLTNVKMPGMDGFDMTEIIKKKYPARVIIFTGYHTRDTRRNAYLKGANAYFPKPVYFDILYRIALKLAREDVVYIGPSIIKC